MVDIQDSIKRYMQIQKKISSYLARYFRYVTMNTYKKNSD